MAAHDASTPVRPIAGRRLIGTLLGVDVDGYRGTVHVRVDGPPDGPTMVLAHGFSGSMRWFDRVVALLPAQLRVIRVDLLGHGGTGGPAVDAPVQARVVDAVLAAFDATDVTAVGHSFGADVAVELGQTSERVARVVVVCQAPDYSDAQLPAGNLLMTVPVLGRTLVTVGKLLAGGLATAVRVGVARYVPELGLLGLADFRALNPAMFFVVLVQRRDRMAAHPLDAQLRETGKPALVVLGGQDHFYGDRSAARYREAGARVEVFADSGHSPLVQFPERLAEELAAFALPVG